MAEATVFICDGCGNVATSRRPVAQMSLGDDAGNMEPVSFDAHDMYCWTRAFRKAVAGGELTKSGTTPS